MKTQIDFSRPPGRPDHFADGHKELTAAIPSAEFYRQPKWLCHRCRAYSQRQREIYTDPWGKTRYASPWPQRYLRSEFDHLRGHREFQPLFDHWGKLKLDDGRVALFSCPYHDDYTAALAFAEALGLELLSRAGDRSHYGFTTSWYLWAEPIAPANP